MPPDATTSLPVAPLYGLLGTIGLALLYFAARTVWRRLDTMQESQTEAAAELREHQQKQTVMLERLDVALRGIDGTNGIVGDVRDLKRRVGRLERGERGDAA